MGATAKPSSKLYTDGVAFSERTGELNRWPELLSFGLVPDTMSGGFSSDKADILLSFVQRDPGYHIITFVGSGKYVNRFVAGRQTIYYLADGDADPDLVYYPCLASNWHLFFEDTIRKTFAMLKDIKNRGQTEG